MRYQRAAIARDKFGRIEDPRLISFPPLGGALAKPPYLFAGFFNVPGDLSTPRKAFKHPSCMHEEDTLVKPQEYVKMRDCGQILIPQLG